MRGLHALVALTASGAFLNSGCASTSEMGPERPASSAIGAVLDEAGTKLVSHEVIGVRRERARRVVRAGIEALAPSTVGQYMGRHEADLRRQIAGTGVEVIRQGQTLLLRIPSRMTFTSDSAELQPQFTATLSEVARSLLTYPATLIDILAHTDSSGAEAMNQRLSVRRADAVAAYLTRRGIARARIATRGYGEAMPITDDDTESGRAANRRIEIKIVPVSEDDVR